MNRENINNEITSLANPKVKRIVKLRNSKYRAIEGITVVEGIRELNRAVEANVMFKECFVLKGESNKEKNDLVEKMSSSDVPIYETTKEVFKKISYGERSEGILAVCEQLDCSIDSLSDVKNPLFVIVERVEKPGNLGAILRTCDGAGVDGVIVCDERTDVFNPNVIRASLGAVFSVKIAVSSSEEALSFLKKKSVKICSALPQAKKVYSTVDLKGEIAIVLGSEQDGLSDFWIKNSDERIAIPMNGKVDSLNVSTSAAILIYEALRQRME